MSVWTQALADYAPGYAQPAVQPSKSKARKRKSANKPTPISAPSEQPDPNLAWTPALPGVVKDTRLAAAHTPTQATAPSAAPAAQPAPSRLTARVSVGDGTDAQGNQQYIDENGEVVVFGSPEYEAVKARYHAANDADAARYNAGLGQTPGATPGQWGQLRRQDRKDYGYRALQGDPKYAALADLAERLRQAQESGADFTEGNITYRKPDDKERWWHGDPRNRQARGESSLNRLTRWVIEAAEGRRDADLQGVDMNNQAAVLEALVNRLWGGVDKRGSSSGKEALKATRDRNLYGFRQRNT